MKHLFTLLILLVGSYAAWQVMATPARKAVVQFFSTHGIRFLIAVLVLLLLFIAAVQTQPFQLF